jgi:hypothetical protein
MSSPNKSKHGSGVRPARPAGHHKRIGIALLVLPGIFCATANAETPITAQAIADHGAFLANAPPPSHPVGLCLVDTGVNQNPDTEHVVVERTAIDGGTGEDVSPSQHGTVMAMMASAPTNNWGMVGTAPTAIQIVSVRILEPGQSTFPFSSYAAGITACLRTRQKHNLRVINLSLGSSGQPSSQDSEALGNAVARALGYGVAVVAAAGNDYGGPVGYPAAYPGVLSVGASDSTAGAFCSFSNRGEGLRLIAPGCDLDSADPITGIAEYNYRQGTSESSVIAAASLAALDSYREDLPTQTAEEDLTGAHEGVLDIAQAFENAGLGEIVTAGEPANEPPDVQTRQNPSPPVLAPQNLPPLTTTMPVSKKFTTRFAVPRIRLEQLDHRSTLLILNRPSDARVCVRFLGHSHHSKHLTVLRMLTGTQKTLSLPAGTSEVSAQYVDAYDAQRVSSRTILILAHRKINHVPLVESH